MADSNNHVIKYTNKSLKDITLATANKWVAKDIQVDFSGIRKAATIDLTAIDFSKSTTVNYTPDVAVGIDLIAPSWYSNNKNWKKGVTIFGKEGGIETLYLYQFNFNDDTGHLVSFNGSFNTANPTSGIDYDPDQFILSPASVENASIESTNLVSENIKKGVKILGREGSLVAWDSITKNSFAYNFQPNFEFTPATNSCYTKVTVKKIEPTMVKVTLFKTGDNTKTAIFAENASEIIYPTASLSTTDNLQIKLAIAVFDPDASGAVTIA